MIGQFRCIGVKLECGCVAYLSTGRYRVSRALAAILYGTALRRGVWCVKHKATCQPVKALGVCHYPDDGKTVLPTCA